MSSRAATILLCAAMAAGCDNQRSQASPSPSPTPTIATVRFTYQAPDPLPPNLPAACVQGVGQTHIHPSWRNFAAVVMQSLGGGRYTLTFTDVPVNARQSIRVSDAAACAENPTGAAARNVRANDVLLVEIVPTPGSGIEPGLAFTVAPDGRVTP